MEKTWIWALLLFSAISFGAPQKSFSENSEKKEIEKPVAKKIKLTIDQVIKRLISQNFDLRKSRFDILKSDSLVRKFRKKYGFALNGEVSGSYIRNPEKGQEFLFNTKRDSYIISGGLSRYFSTGTSLSLALQQDYTRSNFRAGTSPEIFNTVYKTGLIFSLRQSLLKNSFGITDRLTEKVLKIQGDIRKATLINALSGLIVEGIIDYWAIITAGENLKTSRVALRNMRDLYNVILRKSRIGLAQKFEVNQYRSQLFISRNNVQLALQRLFDARLKLLKNLNLDNNLEIESITRLFEKKPFITFKSAILEAIKNRTDLKNALLGVKMAKHNLKIANNNQLPEVNLFANVGSAGQDTNPGGSLPEVPTFSNPQLSVGVKATHILDNEETKTALRDARYELKQARLKVKQLQKDIKDEILSLVKKSNIQYNIYQNTGEAQTQAHLYYTSLRKEIRRGRFSAHDLKDALDNYIQSRYSTTFSLIDYNITLLRMDLAQNNILKRFGLDMKKILADPLWKAHDKKLEIPLKGE